MVKCSKCHVGKSKEDFYKNNNRPSKISSWCKQCSKKNKKEHYKNNKKRYIENGLKGKEWFMDYKKTLSCERCGFSHPAALDFHHKNPLTKAFKLSDVAFVKKNKNIIFEEIKKCEVLCSNCHRIEHSKYY